MTVESQPKRFSFPPELLKAKADFESLFMPPVVRPDAKSVTRSLGWGRTIEIDPSTDLVTLVLVPYRDRRRKDSRMDSVTENTFVWWGPRGGVWEVKFRRVSEGIAIPESVLGPSKLRKQFLWLLDAVGLKVSV